MRLQTFDDENEPNLDEKCHLLEDELARRWRVSARTLQRWRRAGRGPAHLKFGNRIRYPRGEVEQFEARHLRKGPQE